MTHRWDDLKEFDDKGQAKRDSHICSMCSRPIYRFGDPCRELRADLCNHCLTDNLAENGCDDVFGEKEETLFSDEADVS